MDQSRTKRKILGSVFSALVGWMATFFFDTAETIHSHGVQFVFANVANMAGGAFFLAVIFSGIWLIVLYPIYLFIPRRVILWRWPVATLFGTGVAASLLWFSLHDAFTTEQDPVDCFILGALMGGVPALFGSLTARFFVGDDSQCFDIA